MVNLLFITSNNKINGVIESLQPQFKVRIDVVSDFDFGLKDVFEKRPSTVFIQDQIAGVTGESVARHIQMLLGSGSPSFIFMHDGSTKAKPINGLFEHLIDLSQPDDKIVTTIKESLKDHFGPQWDKVYIFPQAEIPSKPDTSSLFSNITEPQDRVSNLTSSSSSPENVVAPENSVEPSNLEKSVNSAFESFEVVSSPQDQLTEILSASEDKPAFAMPGKDVVNELHVNDSHIKNVIDNSTHTGNISVTVDPRLENNRQPITTVSSPALNTEEIISEKSKNTSASDSVAKIPANEERESSQNKEPADFVIVSERAPEQVAPEDLLRVFEGVSRSTSSIFWKSMCIVILFVALGVLTYKFSGLNFNNLNFFSKETVKPSSVPTPSKSPDTSVAPQIQGSPPVKPVESNILPAFVPKSGHDSAYSSNKPGWERYVDSTMDCRIYRSAGKIMAVQVLSVQDKSIKESLFSSVLIELVGSAEFHVKKRITKNGFNVEQAVVGKDSDLLIYRKNREIRAFVVSLN